MTCKPVPGCGNRIAPTDETVMTEQPKTSLSPTDATGMHTVHARNNVFSTSMKARDPTPAINGIPTKRRKTVHFAATEATVIPVTDFSFRAPRNKRRSTRRRLPTATPLTTRSPENRVDRTRPKLTPGGLVVFCPQVSPSSADPTKRKHAHWCRHSSPATRALDTSSLHGPHVHRTTRNMSYQTRHQRNCPALWNSLCKYSASPDFWCGSETWFSNSARYCRAFSTILGSAYCIHRRARSCL